MTGGWLTAVGKQFVNLQQKIATDTQWSNGAVAQSATSTS